MRARHDNQLNADELQRIDQMKNTPWVGYESAITIRQQMDSLIRHPRIARMPNIVLIGDSNNGKSTILRNFCNRHYPADNFNAAQITLPALMVQTPSNANEGALYYEILDHLCAAGSPNEPDISKKSRLKLILEKLQLKVLVLDDLFNIASSPPAKRRQFLNAIRNLGIELQISFIASGTPETLNILAMDPSIQNRFKPVFLPRWKMDRGSEFAKFILSLENSLTLKQPSAFRDARFIELMLIFSEGLLGEAVALLHLLAEQAIRTGKEMIDADDLTREKLKALHWVMPSDRSRHSVD